MIARWILCLLLFFTISLYAQKTDDTEKKRKQQAEREIELIKKIQKLTKNESWTPGMTSHSLRSSKEITQLCGFIPDSMEGWKSTDKQDFIDMRFTIDLRNKGIIGSIKDQGKCGSCWAFAIIGAVEAGHHARDLSEQHLVSCCRSMANGCAGGSIEWPIRWLKNNGGALLEKDYPYTSGTTKKSGECKKVFGQKYKIYGYEQLKGDNKVQMKLYSGRPVITGMKVYEDFRHYKSGIYKHTTGKYLGAHAVLIIGYNSTEKYWIVKNSWGQNWGEKGYFRIAFGDCEIPWCATSVR